MGRGISIFGIARIGTGGGSLFSALTVQTIPKVKPMPNPRLPAHVARVTGADIRSPGRYAGRANPKVRSLGRPPNRFTASQKQIWEDFNDDFPWLGRSDRPLVEVATSLIDQLRKLGAEAPIALYAQTRIILGQMGGTPVDRSKVIAPEEDEIDQTTEFFQ